MTQTIMPLDLNCPGVTARLYKERGKDVRLDSF